MATRPGNAGRFLGTRAAVKYSGIAFNTLILMRA